MSGEARDLSAAAALRHAAAALRSGPPVVSVVVIAASEANAGAIAGRRMLVWAERVIGSLGSAPLDHAAIAAAREVLSGARSGVREISVAGAAYALYLEVHRPPPSLLIVGAGHIARPLCRVGAMLGFRVAVLDDRPEFATRERFPEAERVIRADFGDALRDVQLDAETHLVLITRGHKYDYDVLRDVLRRPVELPYIGMIGSRRRVRAALEELASEGVPAGQLARIYAPIGLDIGAETPEEIAVAIAAEIVRVRRGGSGEPLRDRERVVERWKVGDRE